MAIEPELLGARRLRELLDRHGIRAKKSLGQNFVLDPNTIRKVIAAADLPPDARVVEIGAGAGSLTMGLAAAAAQVVAVELDPALLPVLAEVAGGLSNVEVVPADALTLDLGAFGADHLVANLPYNIAATVVLRVLSEAPQIQTLTVMTQLEVAERLAARPGSKTYGQTSVLVRFFGHARIAARVSRRAFYPEPNVDSAVVRIDRRRSLPGVPPDRFFEVVKTAFGHRRKTLRNALQSLTGSKDRAETMLAVAGVAPTARAEALDLEDFVSITRTLIESV